MKSPDEIKKGLECCKPIWKNGYWKTCDQNCPYVAEAVFCRSMLNGDSIALIQQLETKCNQLEGQNAELSKRLDDLKEVARGNCEWCKHNDLGIESDICKKCVHFSWENDPDDNWELEVMSESLTQPEE